MIIVELIHGSALWLNSSPNLSYRFLQDDKNCSIHLKSISIKPNSCRVITDYYTHRTKTTVSGSKKDYELRISYSKKAKNIISYFNTIISFYCFMSMELKVGTLIKSICNICHSF